MICKKYCLIELNISLTTYLFAVIIEYRKEAHMGMITLKVSDELHKLVRIKVVEEDTTIKDYVTDLILKDLQKEKE